MPPRAVYGISIVFSFMAWGMVTARYVWPALRILPRAHALRPVLVLHGFRFIGLAFLVPGVVSPDLPIAFARPAAYERGPGLARAGAAAEQAGTRLGLGV
jgi:hypothetical protein